jgi:sulfur carrier protein ThiS
MIISVTILPERLVRQVNIQQGSTIEDVLRSLAFLPDSYVVLRDSTPVPITDRLDADAELVAVRVASGG